MAKRTTVVPADRTRDRRDEKVERVIKYGPYLDLYHHLCKTLGEPALSEKRKYHGGLVDTGGFPDTITYRAKWTPAENVAVVIQCFDENPWRRPVSQEWSTWVELRGQDFVVGYIEDRVARKR